MLLTTGMKSMPKDKIISNVEEETWSRRGWGGGGGTFSILLLPRGGGLQFSYVIIWGGG